MAYLLKILNETKNLPFLVLGDIASKEHTFTWNDALHAYTYAPQTQEDSDNLCSLNWTAYPKRGGGFQPFPWHLVPVAVDGQTLKNAGAMIAPAASVARIPPYVRPELYDKYPVLDLQMMCANEGIMAEGNQADADNLKRQLHRYYEGRAWAIEENRRLKDEVASLRRQLDAVNAPRRDPVPIIPDAPPPVLIAAPTAPKPDRAAKAREARKANAAARRAAKPSAVMEVG